VKLMLVAARTVLLPLDAFGMQTLVLRGEVVSVFTLAAGEDDLVSRHGLKWLLAIGYWLLAIGKGRHAMTNSP
jgi:hypothetical protein